MMVLLVLSLIVNGINVLIYSGAVRAASLAFVVLAAFTLGRGA